MAVPILPDPTFSPAGLVPVKDTTGVDVVSAAAPLVQGLITGAGRAVVQEEIRDTQAELRKTLEEISTRRDSLNALESEGVTDAAEQLQVDKLSGEIQRIRLGQQRGTLSTSAGVARINSKVRQLSTQFPQYAASFRGVAGTLTGKSGRATLNTELTQQEEMAAKIETQIRTDMTKFALNPDSIKDRRKFFYLGELKRLRQETEDNNKIVQAIHASGLGLDAARVTAQDTIDRSLRERAARTSLGNTHSLVVSGFIDTFNETVALTNADNGGVFSTDNYRDLNINLTQTYRAHLAKLSSLTLDEGVFTQMKTRLDAERDAAQEMIDSKEAGQYIAMENERVDASMVRFVQANYASLEVMKKIYGKPADMVAALIAATQLDSVPGVGKPFLDATGMTMTEFFVQPYSVMTTGEAAYDAVKRIGSGDFGQPEDWRIAQTTLKLAQGMRDDEVARNLVAALLADSSPVYTIKEIAVNPQVRKFATKEQFSNSIGRIKGDVIPRLQDFTVTGLVRDPKTGTVVALNDKGELVGSSVSNVHLAPRAGAVVFSTRAADPKGTLFVEKFPAASGPKIDNDTMKKIMYGAEATRAAPSLTNVTVDQYLLDLVTSSQPEPVKVEPSDTGTTTPEGGK